MLFVLGRFNLVEISSASQGFLGLLKLASRSDQRFQETLPWSEREDFLMCDLAESLANFSTDFLARVIFRWVLKLRIRSYKKQMMSSSF